MMRLVIAGGGTGGHVSPALATIEALRHRTPLDLLWICTRDGVECRGGTERGIPFRAIQAGKLGRYFWVGNAVDLGGMPVGLAQAAVALRRFRPDVVFGTGGFVSVPTVAAAALLGYPALIHEQTAQVGLANRLSLRFARVVALPYEASCAYLPPTSQRVVVTGNPVRADLLQGGRCEGARLLGFDPDTPTIYATGGARGAHVINEAIGALLPDLLRRYQLVHQCGPDANNGDYTRLSALAASWPPELRARYALREFVGPELPHVYALAALVIGRAGAGTVTELAALGKPAILIPLPGTGGDEQTKNARLLADVGAAVHLPEHALTAHDLEEIVDRLFALPGELGRIGRPATRRGRGRRLPRVRAVPAQP